MLFQNVNLDQRVFFVMKPVQTTAQTRVIATTQHVTAVNLGITVEPAPTSVANARILPVLSRVEHVTSLVILVSMETCVLIHANTEVVSLVAEEVVNVSYVSLGFMETIVPLPVAMHVHPQMTTWCIALKTQALVERVNV